MLYIRLFGISMVSVVELAQAVQVKDSGFMLGFAVNGKIENYSKRGITKTEKSQYVRLLKDVATS